MKQQVVGLARTTWREIIHRDDATDEEKERLIERARKSPTMSRMYAFLHPFLLMRAHRQLKRYQGKTWLWPRLVWVFIIVVIGVPAIRSTVEMLNTAASTGDIEDTIAALLSLYTIPPMVVLVAHFITTNTIRLTETCVWCHVVQRNSGGLIEATLSVLAYRLPFIYLSRTEVSPWNGDTGTYWKSSHMDVTLETEKDVSQLCFADIYDEKVCSVRSAVAIPPSAKRYVAGNTRQYGDIIIKEKRGLDLGLGPQFRTVVIGGVITAFCAIPGVVALLFR